MDLSNSFSKMTSLSFDRKIHLPKSVYKARPNITTKELLPQPKRASNDGANATGDSEVLRLRLARCAAPEKGKRRNMNKNQEAHQGPTHQSDWGFCSPGASVLPDYAGQPDQLRVDTKKSNRASEEDGQG